MKHKDWADLWVDTIRQMGDTMKGGLGMNRMAKLEKALEEIERILGFEMEDEAEEPTGVVLSVTEAQRAKRIIRDALYPMG